MSDSDKQARIAIDNPIRSAREDRLGRADTVKSFVDQILALDASQGVSVGVFGPWGSGKTSFIRLAKEQFANREVAVVEFNPWMFSGSEQLVARFFTELSENLVGTNGLETVGKALAAYGGAVVGAVNLVSAAFGGFPALGQVFAPLIKQMAKPSEAKGLNELRNEVEGALVEQAQPVVVILDDVDRLSFAEIRDVFKLVRLSANFPNLVYVVACDRHRVGQALAEDGDPVYGHRYLEKIIQFPFDLPEVPRHLLETQTEEALMAAVDTEVLRVDESWPDIYGGIVEPLITNMRDVRRYAAVVRATARDLSAKVSQADVLGLEAVRVFLPEVFKQLHGAVDALTYPADSSATRRELARFRRDGIGPDHRSKELVDKILNADKDHGRVVEAMVKYLFPYGDRVAQADDREFWEEQSGHEVSGHRRVADEAVLRLYLERAVGYDLLVLADAERALRCMADGRQEVQAFLRSLEDARRVDVIRQIGELSSDFEPKHARAGVPALLNLLRELPDEPTLIGRRPRQTALAVVFRLLAAGGNAKQIEALAKSILPEIDTLSSKVELSLLIGHSAYESERLVSKEASAEFDAGLAEAIRTAFANDELDEPDELASVVSFPAHVNLAPIELPDSVEIDFRLAHSAQGTRNNSVTGASRYLDWGLLDTLYGSAELARSRVERLCDEFDEEEWEVRLGSWSVPVEAARETIATARSSLRDG